MARKPKNSFSRDAAPLLVLNAGPGWATALARRILTPLLVIRQPPQVPLSRVRVEDKQEDGLRPRHDPRSLVRDDPVAELCGKKRNNDCCASR